MRKVVVLAVAVVAALGVTASSATSAASETGVTARTIVIGGTFPLTGPASLYAPIPASMKAYFSYINSRKGPDGRRGVYGRQIVFNFYDDGYNPAQTVQQTRKLVEEDKVFAVVGSLGTEHNEAIRPYLNAQKVPQILNATGASTWGNGREAVPVDGRLAARVRATRAASTARRSRATARTRRSPSSTRTTATARTYLAGSRRASAPRRRTSSARSRTRRRRRTFARRSRSSARSGATILVIFATPRFTMQAYAIANALRWSPAVIYTNSVSATDTFLTLAKTLGRRRPPEQDVHRAVRARTRRTRRGTTTPAMKLYKQVMAKYHPSGRVTDGAQPLRRRRRARVRAAHVQGGQEPDARVAHEGVPELERGQPVPPAGQPAEDERRRPAAGRVRADHRSSRTGPSSRCRSSSAPARRRRSP